MKLLLSALLLSAATAFSPKAQSHVALRTARPSLAPMESIKITVRNGESVDSVIMRLRREVNKSGHLRTLRNKRYHEDAREKKKRKVRLLGPPHPRPRGAPRDPRAPAQIAESRRKMKFARQRKRRAVRPPRLASRPRPAHRGGGRGGALALVRSARGPTRVPLAGPAGPVRRPPTAPRRLLGALGSAAARPRPTPPCPGRAPEPERRAMSTPPSPPPPPEPHRPTRRVVPSEAAGRGGTRRAPRGGPGARRPRRWGSRPSCGT